jgi:hypothetical protein
LHGVTYEVTTGWDPERMREDLRVIDEELHATSVSVFGTGVAELAATAAEAAERGLHVWVQPRLSDLPHRDILDHLAEASRHAEELRRQGAAIVLSVGCEFLLFVPGIVPGADTMERIENLANGSYNPERMARRLRAFTARAAATGRSVFDGRLTYAEAKEVKHIPDWDLFDLVSIDCFALPKDFAREVRELYRYGKPVVVSEFGACAYKGAPQFEDMGWNVIDWTKPRPEIPVDLVRSERTQANHLAEVFEIASRMDLYAAMVYTFVNPELPHWPKEPRYDLDKANYTIVKAVWDSPDGFEHGWHWEPKLAFRTLARLFQR